jgi:hypothetical protein
VPQQIRVGFVRLDQNMAAEFLDAPEFLRQIDSLLPVGNGLACVFSNALDAEQLLLARRENSRRLAKMFQQLAHPHRADMLDHIQGHKSFPGIHARWVADLGPPGNTNSLKVWQAFGG